MKPFPAVLKERRRYAAFKFTLSEPKSDEECSKALNSAVLALVGEKGFAEANFSVIELKRGKGIVRSTHDRLYDILSAMAFITSVAGTRARVDILGVSGTLATLRGSKVFK